MADLTEIAARFSARDREGFTAALAATYQDDPDIARLNDLVACAFDLAPPPFMLADPLFFAGLTTTINILRGGGTVPFGTANRFAGRTADRLGAPHGQQNWTLPQCVNWLLLGRIRPRRRAAVVVSMRDEGLTTLEWIAHHLTLGFESIFIYTNDNVDGSDALLAALAARGVIVHVQNPTEAALSPQTKAYEHAVHLQPALRDFEWVLFADADELLMPEPRNIGAVLDAVTARYPNRPPSAICYAWLWFVSGYAFARTPGLMLERFQHATPHSHRKSLVYLRDAVSMFPLHFPITLPEGRFMVDGGMEPITHERLWALGEDQYRGGRINHYWPRSFEEFSVKKARTDTLAFLAGVQRGFSQFFAWNAAETAENACPPDAQWLERVRRSVTLLRQMPGVAAAERQVEQRFPALLARWDSAGGLRQIYDTQLAAAFPAPEEAPQAATKTVAIMTMVFNEAINLPIWLRYYAGAVPQAVLIVLDDGSSDGSTDAISPAIRIPLPRHAHDEIRRSRFVSDMQKALLSYYDVVIYVDSDELLVPNPARYASLADYLARMSAPSANAVGLNVLHVPEQEAALDLSRPVLQQRRWCQFTSSMCKPSITTVPVAWNVGFHECDQPPRIDPSLYLFHTKTMDVSIALQRHQFTRQMNWSAESLARGFGAHQRFPDEEFLEHFFHDPARLVTQPGSKPFDFTDDLQRWHREAAIEPSGYVISHFRGAIAEIPVAFRGKF